MLNIFRSLTIIGVAMAVTTPVFAQNINSLETRLNRMEREMQTLSRSVFKGDVAPPTMQVAPATANQTAGMELRLNQLEDQLRRITGMIEENSFRLRKLEQAGVTAIQQQPLSNNNSGFQTQTQPSTDPALVVDNSPYQLGTINNNVGTSPAALYDKAFGFLQVNDYASAQATFDDFLAQYPDHSLAANSKYWLAETYYARGDYKQASQSFARAFKDHPEGQKAPDTLLKLAMSLNAQDMRQEACLTLGELGNRFPNAPSSVSTKAAEERTSYGCES